MKIAPERVWFFSTEPEEYPWDVVFRDGRVRWDGIRGTAARKWMRSIEPGDLILGYHSSPEKAFVCLAAAVGRAYPDPKDEAWLAVDLRALKWLKRRVPLAEMRGEEELSGMAFLRMPRLSVSPVSDVERRVLARLSRTAF